MPGSAYERYGLTSNPFRELTSENLEDIEFFHVNLETDDSLRIIREEVIEKENRAVVALVGGQGAGKTHRLLFTQAEARQRTAFAVYFDVVAKRATTIAGISQAFQSAAALGGFSRVFAAPKWYRDVAALGTAKGSAGDPATAGRVIGAALNASAPAFLLLNDLHAMSGAAEADAFAKTLEELADSIKPGVLVMFGAYPNYMTALTRRHPALTARINRTFALPTLTAEEAGLLLAKKLLAKRLVEDLDPLYPFDREAVGLLNGAAIGNPRRLLELADVAIEYGVEHRAYRVDADLIRAVLRTRTEGGPLGTRSIAEAGISVSSSSSGGLATAIRSTAATPVLRQDPH